MAAPKLRFKEFEGDWEKKTLGEVVKFSNSRRIPLSESDRQKRQGTYRYYGASGVIDYIDDYIFDGQYILIGEDGANILTRSSTLAFVVEGKFWVNNHAHIFQSKKGDNNFLATYLESLNYEKYNSGTAQPKLNLENLKKVIVADPSKEEQTKIASFLSAVDEKISQLTQKHQLLSQYKQGMMQKLFSQQLRFKADDGSEFGAWDTVTLNEVSDVRDGTHDSPKYVREGYPLITSKNLKNGKLDFSNINYISKKDFENINKRSNVDVGDIIFGMIGTIGNPVLLKSNNFAIKNVALIKQKNHLSNSFLIHYLNSSFFEKQVNVLNVGNTQKFLALGQIRLLNILKPCLEEQNKIANFLSAIDQKTEVVAQQIEQAKVWKKGLLQQMFV